jgi:hypothetical protein
LSLTTTLTDYVNAAFTGLWIQSFEPDEAEREIARHAREKKWKLAVWDLAGGLRLAGTAGSAQPDVAAGDPLAAVRALPALADPDGTALLLLHNYHRFLTNPEVVQTLLRQILAGKQQRTFVVILAPVVQIPTELEKLFIVIEHALPDRQQLERIAKERTYRRYWTRQRV